MNVSYFIGWMFFRCFFTVYFRLRFYHPERVARTGPVILAANHASFIDPPAIGVGVNRLVTILARKTLFRFAVTGWVLRSWRAIPVDREGGGAGGLKGILDSLEAGNAVLLFPEGTRTRDGRLQPARSGIGLAVIKSRAPVVPVRIFGSFEAYGRERRIPLPRRVVVKYGKPLDFAELRAEAKSCSKERLKQIYQESADRIMAAIADLEPKRD